MATERPSKVHISATSIQELNLTKDDLRQSSKVNFATRQKGSRKPSKEHILAQPSRSPSGAKLGDEKQNPAKKSASNTERKAAKNAKSDVGHRLAATQGEEKHPQGVVKTSSGPRVKRTTSFSGSKQPGKTDNPTSLEAGLSTQANDRKVSNASLPTAKKSTSAHKREKTQSQTWVKSPKLNNNPKQEQPDVNKGNTSPKQGRPNASAASSKEKATASSNQADGRPRNRSSELVPGSSPQRPAVGGAAGPQSEPSPWGSLSAVIAVAASAGEVNGKRRSASASGSRTSQGRRRSERRSKQEPEVSEEERYLSLSVARDLTNEKKRSFLVSVDDEMLETLRKRSLAGEEGRLGSGKRAAQKAGSGGTSAWSSSPDSGIAADEQASKHRMGTGSAVEMPNLSDGAGPAASGMGTAAARRASGPRRPSSGGKNLSKGSKELAVGSRRRNSKSGGSHSTSKRESAGLKAVLEKQDAVKEFTGMLEGSAVHKSEDPGSHRHSRASASSRNEGKDASKSTHSAESGKDQDKEKVNTQDNNAVENDKVSKNNLKQIKESKTTHVKKKNSTNTTNSDGKSNTNLENPKTVIERDSNVPNAESNEETIKPSAALRDPLELAADNSGPIADSDAGRSQGLEAKKIPEEFFTPPATYRASIDDTMRRLSRAGSRALRRSQRSSSVGTSTDQPPEPEPEPPEPPELRRSSSTATAEGEDGGRSARGRRQSPESDDEHEQWKRRTSAKAYSRYLRDTDPRYRSSGDDRSSRTTTISVYPASSSEAMTVDGQGTWSDVTSEVSEASEAGTAGTEPEMSQVKYVTKECVTVATSTTEMGRTEGTQTSSAEYILLDRRSALVKVLAALQRLNTDEALQVARILRRSLEEDRSNRLYEDADVRQLLGGRRAVVDASRPPALRSESEQAVPAELAHPAPPGQDIPDQDYEEMTRIVSQIDLMVRSKLRITAAPYSLIYETLINYHLEITQDYAPSVAVFNYYLTEQGHPLFDDTSGFFRPTILQVPRESLYPRLYAHQPYGEPRQLPDKQRLLDLQLMLDELLICPFCDSDVVWGQHEMCAEFCCSALAELVASEYEEDLGRIRRQAALRQRRSELGELDESDELLSAALSAASSQLQPPAKSSCRLDERERLRSLQRYGQDGSGGEAPKLPAFTLPVQKKGSEPKADKARRRSGEKRRRGRRRKSGGARHSSEPAGRRRSRRSGGKRRSSAAAAAEPDSEDGSPTGGGTRKRRRRKKSGRALSTVPSQVTRMEAALGRPLTAAEIKEIMEKVSRSGSAHRLSITTDGVRARQDAGSMAVLPDQISPKPSPQASKQEMDEELGEMTLMEEASIPAADGDSVDADDEAGDIEFAATDRRRGAKGRIVGPRRGRRKTRAAQRDEGSVSSLEGRSSHSERARRGDRDSLFDDQMHYRLSESQFLEQGVTQLPLSARDARRLGADEEPLPEPVTHPAESGPQQFLQEWYPDGRLFVTWFADGSGHVLYPSGEPAVLITQESAGRRFVVMPDERCLDIPSSNCVLAVFDPRGIGFVYSETGSPRLLFDQWEGWYHRDDGTIRRWKWSDLDDHVHHSPTLQPVIFAISKHVAIRVMRQDYILLSFWANLRSARFNVGVTAQPAEEAAVSPPYRLVAPADERRQLEQLRDRVRRILADMAHFTDEPAKYIIQNQQLTQRDVSVTISRPVPAWVSAEPREPPLPGGESAALRRRSTVASAASAAARQAFLLQKMVLAQRTAEERQPSGSAGRSRQPPPAVDSAASRVA